MILFYMNRQNKNHQRFIRTMFRSCSEEKMLQRSDKFFENKYNESATCFVFAGFIRGEGLIYKWCKENKKNFLYLDHAYLERGYNPQNPSNEWMRVTYNDFTWSRNETESVDRWNQHFAKKYVLSPWNTNRGKNILVLPPSEATKFLFPESVDWTNRTIEEIKRRTSSPIRIREKPMQVVVDPITNNVVSALDFNHEKTVEKEMLDAKLIVTFNSAVPVLGTILGIPCYCSSYAAAYPMNINLSYINNPPEPKRQDWLNQLVYHQYNTGEMSSGSIWKLLEKYKPK